MATEADVDSILETIADAYSRPNFPLPGNRAKWIKDFAATPAAVLQAAADAAMRKSPGFPPTSMQVAEYIEGPAAGTVLQGCADCYGTPGRREMAVHFERDGVVYVVVRMAACDCPGGRALNVSYKPWRDLWDHWNNGAGMLAIYFTSREMLSLRTEHRETPAVVAAVKPVPRGSAVAHVRASLAGPDRFAGQRRRAIERDREREWEGEAS